MNKKTIAVMCTALIVLGAGISSVEAAGKKDTEKPLTERGRKLMERYNGMLNELKTEISDAVPAVDEQKKAAYLKARKAEKEAEKKKARARARDQTMKAVNDLNLNSFLASDNLDDQLVKYVVLSDATPRGLALFAQQGRSQEKLIERLLADSDLMKQMAVAEGAEKGRYGRAIKIYTDIQERSDGATDGILQRLALAVSLEHAVPIHQRNPKAATDAPGTVDPLKRYLNYEKAYLNGDLDPAFDGLSVWELRMVVDGNEPNWTLSWGREMLRNYRPDHILTENYAWRYVGLVRTDVRYGSDDVRNDRPELQFYQNILMNGGICGRRAFIGRFILRAFGIPTTAHPQTGHGSLTHWTPDDWVICLGGDWGSGWSWGPRADGEGARYTGNPRYNSDRNFLATTQGRATGKPFLQVKRAQWIGDVMGEKRCLGLIGNDPGFWNGVALYRQRAIIENSKAGKLAADGEDSAEADEPTIAEKVKASQVTSEDKEITYGEGGLISIPAAAYSKPSGNSGEVNAMKSFAGGLQVFLPRFFRQGKRLLRGGTWKNGPYRCTSASRMRSAGYGHYENWGFRVAVTPAGNERPRELTLDLGDGVTMEVVYIKPGTFVMGGDGKGSDSLPGRFRAVEGPKHEVKLTKGFYLGTHEVTQAQYRAIMGNNPSKSTKGPNCPVDNISEGAAVSFCEQLAEKTGRDVRLPTEAEWEYACRAGTDTRWFFGDDPSQLGEYAWFKGNADGKSHPVGQKKPNPWGLYDMYGNVCERVADVYKKNYYERSPKVDPTGPSQPTKSCFEYTINAPHAGKYALTARVVTTNYEQTLRVAANDADSEVVMKLPFTCGMWERCKPVVLGLKKGENTLRFSRSDPPQYGVAIKLFRLKPVR